MWLYLERFSKFDRGFVGFGSRVEAYWALEPRVRRVKRKKEEKKARVRGRLFLLVCAFDVEKELPCLHETRLREVNAFHNSKM